MDAILPVAAGDGLRQLDPQWNRGMIVASIAISLLGAFTSTQLMCQARMSLSITSVASWLFLGSLTFGFCSIWSLHFVAMLACELDLPIGIDVALTILSSILAVCFTFVALGSDLLWERYSRAKKKRNRSSKKRKSDSLSKRPEVVTRDSSTKPLLDDSERRLEFEEYGVDGAEGDVEDSPHGPLLQDDGFDEDGPLNGDGPADDSGSALPNFARELAKRFPSIINDSSSSSPRRVLEAGPHAEPTLGDYAESATDGSPRRSSSEYSTSRRSSSFLGSNSSSFGLGNLINLASRGSRPTKNAFVATWEALYTGCTRRNIFKGFSWSLAITSMHYVGIAALRIPGGFVTFSPVFVVFSAAISWVVCLVGCILMSQMETHLTQQVLFSFVATAGVAAMHFTGMRAVTFWSHEVPSSHRGYPPELAVAIVSIAIVTCMAANGLLAHAATISRNKLAEIVWTRRRLWRTIAQKENAEAAAAARSDFIASASHEIRTPLHHLQGYSDLLSRTELTEEGRMLLYAIQRATKTLSLITNNVLDWSKLERDAEAVCRPVALDLRTVCESILVLLPNKDDEAEVELLMVVTPDVPHSLFLDETYIHRILMNLLSNALKFTRSGYILLLIEMSKGKLVATVKDTGCGVPPSFLPQLFEPFKQAQSRGSQRGTGLGLSIIKQLLHKMQGTIEVESKHPEAEDVELDETGSTFTITIPIQLSTTSPPEVMSTEDLPRIAILHSDNERALEGLRTAWEKFGYDVTIANSATELAGGDWDYIWADLPWLKRHPSDLKKFMAEDYMVLVPYDTQNTLQDVPEVLSSSKFIPLQKPLIWHSFKQRIAAVSQPSNRAALARTVRFASKVDILEGDNKEKAQGESTAKNIVVLLVEDNPINQKLGKKMLASLGYQVQVAEDGQDAVEQIVKHDATIDVILMDQSMPRKDGITATREIRDLEAAGTLTRRRPIIAVTAVVNGEAQALFKAAGADDFLAKPLSLSKLETTLAAHLQGMWR